MKNSTQSILIGLLLWLTVFPSVAQITISQPAAGASLPVCTNYTLYYTATSGFSTYVVVEVHQDNSSGPIVKTYTNSNGTTYLSTNYNNSLSSAGLSPGNYQIKMYDYYNPSFYGWSSIFSISDLSAPASVSLMANWGSTFEINWAIVPGATEYRVDVSTTADFQNLLPDYNNRQATGSDPWGFYISGVSAGSTYYVRVRALNSCSTSSNSPALTIFCTPPPAPVATAATNITPSSFVANWNAVAQVNTYNVTITKAGGSPVTYQTSGTSYTFTGAQSFSSYSYTVSASACGTSGASNTISLTTALAAPVLGNGGGDEDERWISWSSVPGAAFYHLQVSEESDFTPIWFQTEVAATNATFDAYMCDDYYLRVRAKAANGQYSAYSAVMHWGASGICRVAATETDASSESDDSIDQGLKSFPNPAEKYVKIFLPQGIEASRTSLLVKDISGRDIHLPVQRAGRSIELDTSGVPAGFYLVSISHGRSKFHSKFIRK